MFGWQELQKVRNVNTANPTTTELLSLDGGLVPHKLASYSNGSTAYFQLDSLGSGRAVTGASGALVGDFTSFGDFGNLLTAPADPSLPSFTGYEHDSYTGLEYAKNRYYDPATASFISSDPYPTDASDLLGMNLYNYVQGNPQNMTDPLGWFVITGFSTIQQYLTLLKQPGDTLSHISGFFGLDKQGFFDFRNNKQFIRSVSNELLIGVYGLTAPICMQNSYCYLSTINKISMNNSTTNLYDYDRKTWIEKHNAIPILSKPFISNSSHSTSVDSNYINGLNTITFHHTATNPFLTNEETLSQLKREGGGIPSYHFIITKDGHIYEGASIDTKGTHVAAYPDINNPVTGNTGNVGVAFVGCFTTPEDESPSDAWCKPNQFYTSGPTEAQKINGQVLVKYLIARYPTIKCLAAHSDLNPTSCPGPAIRSDLRRIAQLFNLSSNKGTEASQEQNASRSCYIKPTATPTP